MTRTRAERIALGVLLALSGLAYATAPAQRRDPVKPAITPKDVFAPTTCTPRDRLFGPDTILAYGPCRDLAMLEPRFRAQVECTLKRMDSIGGWQRAMVMESYRSDTRQAFLYSYGRTRPGKRVTNAKSALTSFHGFGLAVDIIHSKKGWDDPKFFYSLAQHAEACGAVAGYFWKRLPDPPHVQSPVWPGSTPTWARQLSAAQGYQAVWPLLPLR